MATETAATQASSIVDKIMQLDAHTVLNQWVIPYGAKIVLAIVIFIIGRMFARLFSKIVFKFVERSSEDEMLANFVRSITYFTLLLVVIIAALSQLGVNTTSLVALIGAAGLAVGLALQNSLSNFAAGVMILIFKPFRKGHFIEAGGIAGVVEKIGILVLELRTGDNKTVLVPSGKVFGDSITNYSVNETRRVDFIFEISYDDDITEAKRIIKECLDNDARVLKDPAPTIAVGALGASSVQIFTRPWVATSDYWGVHFAVTESVKIAFDKAGISIPFNQLDVHLPQNVQVNVDAKKGE